MVNTRIMIEIWRLATYQSKLNERVRERKTNETLKLDSNFIQTTSKDLKDENEWVSELVS